MTLSFILCQGILEDGRVFVLRVVGVIELPDKPPGTKKREEEKIRECVIFHNKHNSNMVIRCPEIFEHIARQIGCRQWEVESAVSVSVCNLWLYPSTAVLYPL